MLFLGHLDDMHGVGSSLWKGDTLRFVLSYDTDIE